MTIYAAEPGSPTAHALALLGSKQRTIGIVPAVENLPSGTAQRPGDIVVLVRATFMSVPQELEEAALVDGATPWQSFRFIVLPQLVPIISLLAVLRTIWTFNEFDDIFLLTGGAAGTNVASVQIYNYLTVQRNVGQAAAQSVIMALVLIAMLAVYLLILRRRGERV
jgi:multiple sugar transport system permease protein